VYIAAVHSPPPETAIEVEEVETIVVVKDIDVVRAFVMALEDGCTEEVGAVHWTHCH
jgi:hypothetical protein